MKKILVIAMFMMAMSVNASNGFFISTNDTVRIHPSKLDGYHKLTFNMALDGYCDCWLLQMGYPAGITPKLVAGITALEGMTVSYIWRDGSEVEQECPLQVSAAYATIASSTTGDGYWDNDGDGWFDTYGSVKWEPGMRQMFDMNFYVDPSFRTGNLTINGHITSGNDRRGPVLSDYYFVNTTFLWVGYRPGDVTGDNLLTVGDATLIISYLLLDEELRGDYWNNEFSAAAADYDRDGNVTMGDVGKIIKAALVQHIE